MARTLRTAALALVLLLAAGAAPAAAATASFTPVRYPNGREAGDRDPSFINVRAGAAANSVVLARSGDRIIVSDGAGMTAGRRCTQTTPTEVSCPLAEGVFMTLGGGDDTADDGGLGSTEIYAGAGADTVVSAGAMVGGAGNDELTVRSGASGFARLEGGPGDDRLTGGPGDDILLGDAGRDRIDAGAGDDTMYADPAFADAVETDYLDGGPGSDTVEFFGRGRPVTFDLTDDQPEGEAGENEIILGVENANGGDGDDRLVGGPEANRFEGGRGSDTIVTGAGNDRFVDDGETDARVDLGPGTDTVSYASSDEQSHVEVDLSDDAPDGPRGAKDPLAGAEDVIGGAGADHITGNRADNVLIGGDGDDEVHGRRGDDVVFGDSRSDAADAFPGRDELHGGPGDDVLTGGADSDLLDGGWGDDELVGYGGEGRDAYDGVDLADYRGRSRRVVARVDSGGGEYGELDTFVGLRGILGGRGADVLIGSPRSDLLRGRGGRDRIDGRGGRDLLFGGPGGDLLEARDGARDQVSCGGGRDRGRADRADRLRACEPQVRRG